MAARKKGRASKKTRRSSKKKRRTTKKPSLANWGWVPIKFSPKTGTPVKGHFMNPKTGAHFPDTVAGRRKAIEAFNRGQY